MTTKKQEMEQLKHRVRSRTEIDFLRKTLRQNYDRFISNGAGGGGGVAAAMAPQH